MIWRPHVQKFVDEDEVLKCRRLTGQVGAEVIVPAVEHDRQFLSLAMATNPSITANPVMFLFSRSLRIRSARSRMQGTLERVITAAREQLGA